MTATLASVDTDLGFSIRLAAAGVPIVVARRGSDGRLHRPRGWQNASAEGNAARLADRMPGDGLFAVCGAELCVIDVDPRNGGDVENVRGDLRWLGVRVFAEVNTPGGGAHFYIAGSFEIPTMHSVASWPGTDVQSHGANVWLPGTVRPEYPGKGYTVVYEDPAALAEGDVDGVEALADFLSTQRPTPSVKVEVSPPWDGTPHTPEQERYLASAVQGEARSVASAPPGGRNAALNTAAFKLGGLVLGAGLRPDLVVTALLDASEESGLLTEDGQAQCLATIRSGMQSAQPRAIPTRDANDVFGPGSVEIVTRGGVTATVVEPNATQNGDPVDSTPHLDAGVPDDLPDGPVRVEQHDAARRRVVLTSADRFTPRRVKWLWNDRIARGTLALLAGPEGQGKSTLTYDLIARITRGELEGEYFGAPHVAFVCASEDSWEYTIVPRLIAAGADLALVFRVEVMSADNLHLGLSLPRDLQEIEEAARQTGAVLLVLDPLMSRLADALDTHRDGDVRRALEPLVEVADRCDMTVLGLIHHNKSGSVDPLQIVMGSKAFTAVARSVHTVIPDPDDETGTRRLFGTVKNNLGRSDLSVLAFTIVGYAIPTSDGDAWTGRIKWAEEIDGSIGDVMRRANSSTHGQNDGAKNRTPTRFAEAREWLQDYLLRHHAPAPASQVKRDGRSAGHAESTLKRAANDLGVVFETPAAVPRTTTWRLPEEAHKSQSAQSPRGEILDELTEPTGRNGDYENPVSSAGSAGSTFTVLGQREPTVAKPDPHGRANLSVLDVFGTGKVFNLLGTCPGRDCPEHTTHERHPGQAA